MKNIPLLVILSFMMSCTFAQENNTDLEKKSQYILEKKLECLKTQLEILKRQELMKIIQIKSLPLLLYCAYKLASKSSKDDLSKDEIQEKKIENMIERNWR